MSAIGAIFGLLLAILLILKKVSPFYAMMAGALAGSLTGGADLSLSVKIMMEGVNSITPAVVRILAAGVLTGVLIRTGGAMALANGIIRLSGERFALGAIALATLILTASGVFIDVAVITVAPIALALGKRLNLSKLTLLFAMIGGGKCGNIISPNPNTIVCAENLGAPLASVMAANIIPAIVGFLGVIVIMRWVYPQGIRVNNEDLVHLPDELPSFWSSVIAPITALVLLSLRPLVGITIDPMLALPIGGLTGIIAMKRTKELMPSLVLGLEKMTPVAVLLIGTGFLAGVIKASTLNELILSGLQACHLPTLLIAPLAGALLSGATASTTAGATVASSSFSEAILSAGTSPIEGAAMINAGATVLDHLPHGSFFHATAGAAAMSIGNRMKLIPFESIIGALLATISTLVAAFL
ncbi:MAG: GntP family permease [Bacteroidales bacterium]|nr:GntP family permease [Bacteroidales bacterium]